MRGEEAGPTSFEGDSPAASDKEALPDRRELALVAVERTRMPMVVTDAQKPDHPIVLANEAFLKLTGYTAEEVVGRNCRFLQGPGTAAEEVAKISDALAAGEGIEIELLNYRKDGTSFWNQLVISPVTDDAGTLLYHFASQKDVSARRRAETAEQSERLLLMEVDHRALNALALVQSFLRFAKPDSVEDYMRSVEQRVDTLARAHRLLASTAWTGAELGELISLEIPAPVAEQVQVDGPVQPLSPRIVQPLALALHELMTNAVASGALAAPDGMLSLSWGHEPGGVVLHWREQGTPEAPLAPTEGFGLRLVRGVVERQLGGRVSFDWTEDGLAATLVFPPDGVSRAVAGHNAPFRLSESASGAAR